MDLRNFYFICFVTDTTYKSTNRRRQRLYNDHKRTSHVKKVIRRIIKIKQVV